MNHTSVIFLILLIPLYASPQLLELDDSFGEEGSFVLNEHPDKRTHFLKPFVFRNGDVAIPWIVDQKLYFSKLDADGKTVNSFGNEGNTSGFPFPIGGTPNAHFIPKPDGGIIGISRAFNTTTKQYYMWFLSVDANGKQDEHFEDEKLQEILADVAKTGALSGVTWYKDKYFIIAGSYNNPSTKEFERDPFALKVHFNGEVDEYFGDGGFASHSPNSEYISEVYDVKILSNEQVLLVERHFRDGVSGIGIICFAHDGAVNHHFGEKGYFLHRDPQRNLRFADASVRLDNVHVLFERETRTDTFPYLFYKAQVLKVSDSGEPDSSFGKNGLMTLSEELPLNVHPESINLYGPNYFFASFIENGEVFHLWKYARKKSGSYVFAGNEYLDISHTHPNWGNSESWIQDEGKIMVHVKGYYQSVTQRYVDKQITGLTSPSHFSEPFEVYPTPFSDRLQVTFKTAGQPETLLWSLNGLDGKQLDGGELRASHKQATLIPQVELKPGVYLLTLQTEEIHFSLRVVKRE